MFRSTVSGSKPANCRRWLARVALASLLAAPLALGFSLAPAPAAHAEPNGPIYMTAPTYASTTGWHQAPAFNGECASQADGAMCLTFRDGFVYLARETIANPTYEYYAYGARAIEVVDGVAFRYYHVVGTDLMAVMPK